MNVIVIMFDSLRPDHLGCLGNKTVRTPNFDAFAAESCVFTNATAEFPITIPSRTAFVTGNYTFTNRPWCALREGEITLGQLLQKHGYRTAAFSDTPFRVDANMDRGFDEFNWVPGGKCHLPIVDFYMPDVSGVKIQPELSMSDARYYMNTIVSRAEYMKRDGIYFPDVLTREAFKWLDEYSQEKFMLWLDYFDPHEPWDPPEPYASMYDPDYKEKIIPMPHGPDSSCLTPAELKNVRAQYAGCVTQVDDQFGKLRARLEEQGLWDSSIIVLVSDHGEPFGEHGQIRKFNVPVYDELSRIVFMVRVPGMKSVRSDALAQNTDLMPTLLSLLGAEVGHTVDGVDLSPLVRGEASVVRERAYSGAFQMRSSIRTSEWKFIDNQGEKPNELFYLINDPGETVNLLEKETALVSELHRELHDWRTKWSGVGSWRAKPWSGEDLTDLQKLLGS